MNASYNAANRKDVRAAEKAARLSLVIRGEVITGVMSVTNGRQWMHELLSSLHFFTDPFNADPYIHAAQSGQRGIAIQLFGDIMGFCPAQFTLMIEEHYVRLATASERTRSTDTRGGVEEPDTTAGAETEWEPGAGDQIGDEARN